MKNTKITQTTMLDQELVPCEEPTERILEIALQAPEVDETFQRPPLNLALVIDRSGSMSGHKVEYAKQAASHVVGLLDEKDRVALVQYDDRIDVLFPSTKIDNESRPMLQQAISSITSRGSTNLCDGWLTGCQEVAGSIGDGVFSHSLLLSDGLANVGITNANEIAAHARELARRGISSSTFGIGTDFDHHLMEDMANEGEGVFKFIESPRDIPQIFEGVFKELLTIVAHDVEVEVSCPEGVNASVLGDYRHERPEQGKLRIYLGSLSAAKSKDLFAKLSIAAQKAGTVLPIKIHIRAKDEKGKLVELDGEAIIKVVSKEEAASAVKNEELLKRFAQVEIGDRASAALRLEKEGRRQEASELLKNILKTHESRVDKETHQHYQDMSVRMAVGMDELDRKRSHSESYMLKKMMMGARSYPLMENVAGHLVFEKDGQNLLLDTGSHITIGRNENFEFMGKYRQIQPNFLEFSPDYLTKMIGVQIDTLLGMDVLKDLWFRIDLREKLVHFSEFPLQHSGMPVPLEMVMGVPFMRTVMNNSPQKVFVDSGAKIHFVRKNVVDGLEAIDTEMDWYPYIGEFETEVFEIPIELAGETHSMRCGVLPPLLDTALSMTGGIEGLLGTEIFNKYIVTFEPGTHVMYLERY